MMQAPPLAFASATPPSPGSPPVSRGGVAPSLPGVGQPNVPPQDDTLVGGYPLARIGDRLLAVILDTIFLGALFALVGMWAAARWGGVTENGFSLEGRAALITITITALVGFLYYWILEGAFGATLGKAIVSVQVRNKNGGPCGMGPSLIRNLLRIVDGIAVYLVGFLVAVFSKLRQRTGDHLAKTIVVEKKSGALARTVVVLLWLTCVVGGIVEAYLIHRGVPPAMVARSATSGSTTSVSPGSTSAPATTLRSTGDLKIVNFKFLQSANGSVRLANTYKPGDKVYTSYDTVGFGTDSQGRLHLHLIVVPFDSNGLSLYAPWNDEMNQAVESADTPAHGYYNFDLPPFVPGGTFKLRIMAHDSVKNSDSELMAAFSVEANPIPVFGSLEFRDCQLSLTEDGPSANPTIIQPGGKVFAACKLGGMRFQDDRPNVHIALQVVGPGGSVILDKPDFLDINDLSPYHPPTIFSGISSWVSLPSDAASGVYIWRQTVTDRFASATIVQEMKFEVR